VAGHVALLFQTGGDAMAFNSSSYFVGVGTAFAAIAVGFAGGAMITTSTVQPPNRLERVAAGTAPPPSVTSSQASQQGQASQQASVTTPAVQPSPPTVAVAPTPAIVVASAPTVDSPPVPQPQPPAPVVAKIDAANAQQPTNAQQVPQAARSEDAAPAKNERANARPAEQIREASRSADISRETPRKRGDERKFTERKRRQDLDRQNLDEATNVVRQMPRDGAVARVVEEDDASRFNDSAPRRLGLFGSDEDSPRPAPPPRFGLFGQ
jgi:hypothetical protein